MASQDVIELGSSDDEPEPAAKKMKPLPNAMVHIPTKRPAVSKKQTIANVKKKLAGKPVTITLVEKQKQSKPVLLKVNPFAKTEINSGKKCNLLKKPINITNGTNISIASSSSSKSATTPQQILRRPVINLQALPKLTQVTKLIKPKRLPNLSGVTIKRTPMVGLVNTNQLKPGNVSQKTGFQKIPVDYPLVQLDCEDPLKGISGPQWYIKPEESNKVESIEEQNNAEPRTVQTIEITIEDSPVKPSSKNRMHEVGTELAITIEDSPVKLTTANDLQTNSDDDSCIPKKSKTHSKKQLRYPKMTEVVEIEIEPIKIDDEQTNEERVIENKSDNLELNSSITQKDASPTIKPKFKEKEEPKCEETNDDVVIVDNSKEHSEFHSVYQNFIDLCFKLEKSNDMEKIVEKKIKSYYRQVPKDYRESEEFIDMIQSKILAMQAGPEKMYLYIKDVVDELNIQRKMAQAQQSSKTSIEKTETEKPWYEDADFDNKRQRQIRKLEKTLKKLHRAIQKLEEQEVDFDDDDDSVYLLTERYKERMVRVHAKFCQLTNTKMPSEPRIHIESRPGRPTGPAQRLEKWINKKVPIGTPLPFPDFHDVLKCVRDANTEDKLYWNEADIMDEARDLFTRCGKKLQRRRQENEWRLAASRISAEVDPSEDSDELRKKLENNRKTAAKRESEVLNKYADKQNILKLEAIEINDKEADESPIESEEDDFNEENTALKSKEKRKERLKRLIEEKSKRGTKVNNENKNPITDDSLIKENEKMERMSLDCDDNDKKEVTTTSNEIKLNEPEGTKLQTGETEENVIESDDSDILNSDIDELHLLQKLHSENEINSSPESSSDTPNNLISLSDSVDECSENYNKWVGDVISIENSSVSESEANVEDNDIQGEHKKKNNETQDEVLENNQNETDKTQNELENILLASSDDDDVSVNKLDDVNTNSLNLLDDNISISDTIVSESQTVIVKEKEVELKRKSKNISENFENSGNTIENQNITTNSNENKYFNEMETSNPDTVSSAEKDETICHTKEVELERKLKDISENNTIENQDITTNSNENKYFNEMETSNPDTVSSAEKDETICHTKEVELERKLKDISENNTIENQDITTNSNENKYFNEMETSNPDTVSSAEKDETICHTKEVELERKLKDISENNTIENQDITTNSNENKSFNEMETSNPDTVSSAEKDESICLTKEVELKRTSKDISENVANSENTIENKNKTTNSNENKSFNEMETSNPDTVSSAEKDETICLTETISDDKTNNKDDVETQHTDIVKT